VIAAVQDGDVIYVVEGERDVEAAFAAGAVATTNPGGAGKWQHEYSEFLRDAEVIVVFDRDDPGRTHARQVAASLKAVRARVRFAHAKQGNDLSDHLEAGYGLEDLVFKRPRGTGSKPKHPSRQAAGSVQSAMYQLVVLKLREYAVSSGVPAPEPHRGREAYEACCPAHDDRRASLGVAVGNHVPVLLYCQAGCDTQEVISALGIDWAEFNAANDWHQARRGRADREDLL